MKNAGHTADKTEGITMDQITALLEEYYHKRIERGTLEDAYDFFNAVKIPTEEENK